ncbi:MAG: matrixin family metalloprotease, partial [Imperialibacter sp.]
SEITVCTAEHEIKRALEFWASVADLEFVEVTDQGGDIQFIAADITQGGIGYPNYTDDLCSTLAGQLIIDVPTRNSCDGFYNLVLHEIGHILGLGHVSTSNIMNPGFSSTELQPGDIQGIQSIYGAR